MQSMYAPIKSLRFVSVAQSFYGGTFAFHVARYAKRNKMERIKTVRNVERSVYTCQKC